MGTSIDNVIQSVVNEYHWSPFLIDKMYLDDIDHYGLKYYYDALKKLEEKAKDGSDN